MSIPSSLFNQPAHCIIQKARKAPFGFVRISPRQDIKKPAGTNAQKAGMRYENRVGERLQKLAEIYDAALSAHTWFEANGRNYQPDFFLVFPSQAVILFEVKQTWVDTSEQLAFYKHLLTKLAFGPITCCTICKNLTPETPRSRIIHSFDDIVEGAVWQLRI